MLISVCSSLTFFYCAFIIYLMRKKNLRIHKPKHSSFTEPSSFFEMSEESPQIDGLKKYLAELQDEPMSKEKQLSSSFSFDIHLTDWNSNNKLNEAIPLSTVYSNSLLFYQGQQQAHLLKRAELKPSKVTPGMSHSKQRDQEKRRKMLFSFSKGRFRNKTEGNNTSVSRQKKWIKPSLYSLQQPKITQQSRLSIKKRIKINLSSCRNEKTRNFFNFTTSQKEYNKLEPFGGIHCFRNKFQLILNSRSIKRKELKLFKCSTIRPLLDIQILNLKHS